MAKLALKANPTFTHAAPIHVAGAEPVTVKFTFNHRTKAELAKFRETRKDFSDLDSFMDMVCGWDIEDTPFNRENANEFLETYIGSALTVYSAYLDELEKAKVKN